MLERTVCLSVRQPWAWLLFHGKRIENREWATPHRGRLVIHASAGMTIREYEECLFSVAGFDRPLADRIPRRDELVRGALIGEVVLLDCLLHGTSHARQVMSGRLGYDSNWFHGPVGWLFDNPLEWDAPIAARGTLGLWDWHP